MLITITSLRLHPSPSLCMIQNLLVQGVGKFQDKRESQLDDPVGSEGREGAEELVWAVERDMLAFFFFLSFLTKEVYERDEEM